ncbi:MAG: hypothetical protein JXL97_08725, partial [Bacteroidales bacterium]|nr:hypothetical protein [Bacteroidales bacterium]
MKKILFILFFIPVCIFAQNLKTHKQVIAGLNNYMEFIHETTHTEYLFQSDIMSFNSSLLSKSKRPSSKIYFDNRERLSNITYFEQLPEDIFNKCLTTDFPITAEEKQKLDDPLISMWNNIQNIQIICDSIETDINNGVFEDTSSLKIGFRLLEEAKLEFYNYLLDWNILKNTIEEVASKYEVVDLTNPYINAAKNLDTLFDVVYEIAEFARNNDTVKVRQLKQILEEQIQKLDGQENVYLEGAKSYGKNNGKDPFGRFENVIDDAKAELSHTKYFLKPTKYPSYAEKLYGKPFTYYNDKFINKFNRHGIGMAYDYNVYADNSDNLVLKKAQMPHTLIVIYPETNKKEPEPDPEKLTLKDAPPNNLIFLLDVSSSMNKPEKMPLLKESIKF